MKYKVKQKGISENFIIDSCATSREELGNDIYPPAKRCLREHGIPFSSRRARQITEKDFEFYDKIIAMESYNLRNMRRLLGPAYDKYENKISLLLDHTGLHRDVEDPWYSGDFEGVYSDIDTGCDGLLDEILSEENY